jgi:hypothetical protein
MHPQINIQLTEDNVPTANDRRQFAQKWLEGIQKAKDDKIPRLLKEGDQVWYGYIK